jgi:hypothetical protein
MDDEIQPAPKDFISCVLQNNGCYVFVFSSAVGQTSLAQISFGVGGNGKGLWQSSQPQLANCFGS